jgi:membrane-associated phospholipid phosphatase
MALATRNALIAIAVLQGSAFADTPGTPAPTAPTASAPTTAAPTAPAEPASPKATQSDESTIAPPAPDAPPTKVEDAKEVAKTAELTPLVPSPKDATRPAFQLYAEIDIPVLAVGTVFAFARRTKTQPAFCAPRCDSVGLNPLDKLTAGYYSAGWSRASDVGLYGIGAAAALLLVIDEGWLPALNDAVVIGEATLSATAVASIMTLAAGRPRPFLYGDPANPDRYKAPLSVRNSGNAALSFLSSHTAESFAIATSLYLAQRRLHPRSTRSKVILAGGLAVSSFVAAARVMAGYHFITDVIGGAIVGSALGVLIGSVHPSPVKVVPVVNETSAGRQAGIGIQGTF